MEEQGTLYIIATPLGNDADLSPRAAKLLEEVDILLAEDTRRTGLLLSRLGISRDGGFVSCHDHNEEQRISLVKDALAAGKQIGLVSDAGTPVVSDPGYRLVGACRKDGFNVHPVPGPCAPVTALSACGLPPHPFTFLGFMPRKAGQIKNLFSKHGPVGTTLVFFDRKSRVHDTLGIAAEVLGKREFCIARELTKDYEEFVYGELDNPASWPKELRGELTIIIGPPDESEESSEEQAKVVLAEEQANGGKPKEISRRAAERLNGWTSKELYALLREI
ncbi:MAG: 16S rRNA (cytidine(1402)-2'-O)-methyltransferase [Desulfovibrio sp.]